MCITWSTNDLYVEAKTNRKTWLTKHELPFIPFGHLKWPWKSHHVYWTYLPRLVLNPQPIAHFRSDHLVGKMAIQVAHECLSLKHQPFWVRIPLLFTTIWGDQPVGKGLHLQSPKTSISHSNFSSQFTEIHPLSNLSRRPAQYTGKAVEWMSWGFIKKGLFKSWPNSRLVWTPKSPFDG